ncbi:MAG TPA: O-antigen ligase family protein [Ferruginibacter sp.]|nr:O-antigen ligase family protein [Ferruginibacter sp.]
MKKLFCIQDTLANKISYYHLLCFVIALPFDTFFGDVILISFSIHTVLHFKKERLRLLIDKQFLLLTSLYVVTLIGFLYSPYKEEGISLLTRQLAFILFPVLFALNEIDIVKYKFPLIKIFGLTTVVIILFLYVDALRIICYFHLPIISLFNKDFINHNFSHVLDLHATYISMYVAFSLSAFIYFLLVENILFNKILYSIFICILLAGLIQLSSRAVLIAEFIIIFIAFPLVLLRDKKRIQFILFSSLSLLLVFFVIANTASFKDRFTSGLKDDLTQPSSINHLTEPRLVRWQAEMELIKKSPVIGYGSGAEKDILKQKYFEKKLYLSYLSEFNAHSQYLSFLLNLGMIGCGLFIFILCYGFNKGIKDKDILLISFLIIIAVTAISEDILNLNKGIFFYGFFISFLLLFQNEDKLKPKNMPEKATP